MKSAVCAIVILALIVGGGIISSKALDNFSTELTALNESVYNLSLSGDFDKAEQKLDEIEKLLEDKRGFIGSIIELTEFEKIELNVECMRLYIKEKMPTQIKNYYQMLDYYIKHLPKGHKLKIENIL